ncbi:hypothetical protein SAMN02910298_02257 [Pseudobutyrivibrio sp. YE44]|nr:hypothetical protein SAMN02910298_02257 [Pseudobutyrivibrio sp. YE44]
MQEVKFHCKKCKKSIGLTYNVSGNPSAPVLPNFTLKCRVCRKVSTLRNYTESMILERIDSEFKFYL